MKKVGKSKGGILKKMGKVKVGKGGRLKKVGKVKVGIYDLLQDKHGRWSAIFEEEKIHWKIFLKYVYLLFSIFIFIMKVSKP